MPYTTQWSSEWITWVTAYRQNHSLETAVIKVYIDIIIHIRRGRDTMLIFLASSVTFGTVDHDIPHNNLLALGIDGIVMKWFRTETKIQILCQNHFVWWMPDEKWSSLGKNIRSHIFFLIYTIELHNALESLDPLIKFTQMILKFISLLKELLRLKLKLL